MYGSKGSIVCKRGGEIILLPNPDDQSQEVIMHVEPTNTIRDECAAFVTSIRCGSADSRISFEDGRNDLEVVEAAYMSIAEGKQIELPLKNQ